MIPGVYAPPARPPAVPVRELTTPAGQPVVGDDGLLIPSHRSFAAVYNELSGVYWTKFDEALRDNPQNALAMRRDVHLRALLQERLMPSVNAKRSAEVDDDKDARQAEVRDGVKRLVGQIPRFSQLCHCLLEAVWYGRAAVQGEPGRAPYGGGWTWVNWAPVHGDSLQFTHDGTPIVMVGNGEAQRWRAKDPDAVVVLDRGGWGVRLYKPEYRQRFVVHRHQVSAADYFEGEFAGQRHGEGLRGIVYWSNWLRTESFSWMLAYCQGVGSADIICVNYPEGNKAAQKNAEAIARQITGKIAFAVPRKAGESYPFIETVPANAEGMKFLRDLIEGYFDRGIERLFVGQSMSSGGGAKGGLEGDGRAELARDTKAHLIDFDSANLDETLTADLYDPIKRWNYPTAAFPVRCKASNPEAEGQRRLEVGLQLVGAGVPLKADELRQLAGFSKPADGDEVVGGVQPGLGGPGAAGVPGRATGGGDIRPPAGGRAATPPGGDSGSGTAADRRPPVPYEWDESQHPRDDAGQFTDKPGGSAASKFGGADWEAVVEATRLRLEQERAERERAKADREARKAGRAAKSAERERRERAKVITDRVRAERKDARYKAEGEFDRQLVAERDALTRTQNIRWRDEEADIKDRYDLDTAAAAEGREKADRDFEALLGRYVAQRVRAAESLPEGQREAEAERAEEWAEAKRAEREAKVAAERKAEDAERKAAYRAKLAEASRADDQRVAAEVRAQKAEHRSRWRKFYDEYKAETERLAAVEVEKAGLNPPSSASPASSGSPSASAAPTPRPG